MNLTIEGDLAKHLTALLKQDAVLARSFAQQWLTKIAPKALRAYLLNQDTATDLLVQLLQAEPKKTLEDLEKLAKGKAPKRMTKKAARRPRKKAAATRKKAAPKKRGPGRPKKKRGPGRAKKAKPVRKIKPARKAAAKPKTGKRIRLTAEQVQVAKGKILKLLGSQAWGTRKELVAAAALPTQAAYRRVVVELLDAGEIVAKGERSKRVYGLKGR